MYELRRRQPWRLWQLWWIGRLWRLVLLCRLLGHRLVRPFVGTVAALALIIGGMMLFEFSEEPAPKPVWQVCTLPVIKPPPTNSRCHNGQPFGPNR